MGVWGWETPHLYLSFTSWHTRTSQSTENWKEDGGWIWTVVWRLVSSLIDVWDESILTGVGVPPPAAPATIKQTPGCRSSPRPPGCKWTLSCWPGSAWSPCLNCPGSHWRQRARWAWGTRRCSWCTSCSSSSGTARWCCRAGRRRPSERWRCWRTGACRPRCRTACRLLSHHTRCSRRDRWSRYPGQRSEGGGWNLEQEGTVDRQESEGQKRSSWSSALLSICTNSVEGLIGSDMTLGSAGRRRIWNGHKEQVREKTEALSCVWGGETDASVDEGSVLNCSPISLRSRNRTPRA